MAQPTQERLASQLEKPQHTSGNVGHAGSGVGPENAPHFQDHEDEHVHQVAMKTYYIIFSLLIFLLLITVGAWYFDQHVRPLGHLSTPIAMAIAVAKAVAIVLFFMHVKFSSKLVQIFACTGIAFVAIMFLLTFNDYGTRYSTMFAQPGVYNIGPNDDNNGTNNGILYRSSSVGSTVNSQSTPSDNVIGSAINAPGNSPQTTMGNIPTASVLPATTASTTNPGVLGTNVTVGSAASSGATTMNGQKGAMAQGSSAQSAGLQSGAAATQGAEQSGALGASGMASGSQDVATSGSAADNGTIIGGAANNVYGSSAQSQGIEPKPAAPVTRSVPKPVKATAMKPATAVR